MIRLLATIVLATALLPAGAEAAKLRLGGSRSSHASAETQSAGGRSVAVVPGLTRSSKGEAKPDAPTRPPFPAPSVQPPPALRLTSSEGPKNWCRSEVVVGGFCVLN
jgi:hypothetical protein